MVESSLDLLVTSSGEQPETVEQSVNAVISPTQAIAQAEKALKDIYFVSGLGADERVFRLLKFEGYRPIHIHWLQPEPGESMEHYAHRLTAQIKVENPIIVGLSFGGMVAVEIAKQIKTAKVILISSAKTKFEIPAYFRLLRRVPIHYIFPFKTLLWAGYWLVYWFFDVETQEERRLLKAILVDTDAYFLKWALHKVVTWNNETVPPNLDHIHGSRDRIFPLRFVKADHRLEKGGHLMILNRAGQVSTLLEKVFG